MADYLPKHGIYQVWQTHRRHSARDPTPEFPRDFRHVANVDAPSLEKAFHLAHGPERSWMDNPGVEVIKPSRPIDIGDVIVDQQRQAHRVEKSGYTQIGRIDGRGNDERPDLNKAMQQSIREESVLAQMAELGVRYEDRATSPSQYARSTGKQVEKGLER